MPEVHVKQGETLLLQMAFINDDGSSVDLTSVTLTAQVRTPQDVLVATLTIVKTIILNVATVQADTTLWPLGLLRCDVKAIIAGLTEKSETFSLRVNRAVTQ